VFAVDDWRRCRIRGSGEECRIYGAAGSDGAGNDELDEITARMGHTIS
jgi:hypothetical protein